MTQGKAVTHTKYIFVQIIFFLVSKQITLGTIFHSKLDSSHNYFIVINHPPNWLCLKHISGLDCGNWGLSRPNSHVITTGTVFPSPPKCTSSFLPGSNTSFRLSLPAGQESNLMDVFTQTCCQWWGKRESKGKQWCKKQDPPPLRHFNEDLEFLQVNVGGAADACQPTKCRATRSALVWRQLFL